MVHGHCRWCARHHPCGMLGQQCAHVQRIASSQGGQVRTKHWQTAAEVSAFQQDGAEDGREMG